MRTPCQREDFVQLFWEVNELRETLLDYIARNTRETNDLATEWDEY